MGAIADRPDIAAQDSQLRFVTAGGVDDGKSTLIGRLLYDSNALMRDTVDALGRARRAHADEALDLSLVTDGLEAEREQGITIDVAYRYFATPRRSFIIADAPGHEQYTRNLVTAASTADVAIILIDASRTADKPLRIQTRRHATIAHMLGLSLVFAVNKMDLVDWSQRVFDDIAAKAEHLARSLGASARAVIPVSAANGDNVARGAPGVCWYRGPTLLEDLEAAPARAGGAAFRFPVQRVARHAGRRLYQGRVEGGAVAVGDRLVVLPSARAAHVAAIETFDGPLSRAAAGQSVSIALDDELDVARGDTLAAPGATASDRFTADLCWLDEQPWRPGVKYLLKQGARTAPARIDEVVFVREMAGLSQIVHADGLALNDIASVRLRAQAPLVADAYDVSPGLGAFVLIDPVTNQTAAAGMIRAAA